MGMTVELHDKAARESGLSPRSYQIIIWWPRKSRPDLMAKATMIMCVEEKNAPVDTSGPDATEHSQQMVQHFIL